MGCLFDLNLKEQENSSCFYFQQEDEEWNLSYYDMWCKVKENLWLFYAPYKQLVFIFCENNCETIMYYLTFMHSNYTVALFDKNLSLDQKKALIEIYQPNIICNIGDIVFENYHYDRIGCLRYGYNNKKLDLNPDLALLLSTSGSTGNPKLVRLTYKNVLDNAVNIADKLNIDSFENPITSLPIHYSYGLSVLNSHIIKGASITVTNHNILAKEFWDTFRKNNCSSFAGVPGSYHLLKKFNFDQLNIPTLKTMTQAGGKLDEESILYFNKIMKQRGGKFFVMYGQTEATARICILPSEKLEEKIGFAGLPIGGSIKIENPNEENVGEVVFTGDNVMMGYAETKEDLNKGDELNGVLHTGDLGFLDIDGFLKIVGRNKRIAKVLGMRYNLDEIENEINKAIGRRLVVVNKNDMIVVYDCYENHKINSSFEKLAELVVDAIHNQFHINKSLICVVPIQNIPCNANGKIDYKKLEELEDKR